MPEFQILQDKGEIAFNNNNKWKSSWLLNFQRTAILDFYDVLWLLLLFGSFQTIAGAIFSPLSCKIWKLGIISNNITSICPKSGGSLQVMVMVIFAAINHYYGIITNKQAPSSDKLPAAIFKLACSGIFPDDWKVAKVLPKYKSNDRCDPSNY